MLHSQLIWNKYMSKSSLLNSVANVLAEYKAENVTVLNVSHLTQMTDTMVICTGNSTRHTKTIGKELYTYIKNKKLSFTGMEGEETGEWILIDLVDVMVHIMLTATRDYYQLEKLWDINITDSKQGDE